MTKKKLTFPNIVRKKTLTEMYEQYEAEAEANMMMDDSTRTRNQKGESRYKIGRSSYMKVGSMITGEMDQTIKCCDFVTDRLINEQIHMLQKIINELIDPKIKKRYTEHLLLTQNFLKYQFDDHARKNDGVSEHDFAKCLLSLTNISFV